MGKAEVERFLTHLPVERNVAASTQNQALSAIVFLYKEVLGRALEWLDNVERAKRPARVPVVLTEAEVRAVLAQRDGRHALMAGILYGEAVCTDQHYAAHALVTHPHTLPAPPVRLTAWLTLAPLRAPCYGVRENR